jgi:hypothetical protein
VVGDASPVRAMFEDEEHRHDGICLPQLLAGEDRGDAALHIQPAEYVAHVVDSSLDLDDDQGVVDRVVGEHVDSSTIAVVVEAVLHQDRPPVLAEHADEPALQPCVALVRQRALTVDAEVEADVGTEGDSPSLDLCDAAVLEGSTLAAAQLTLGDVQLRGQPSLGPPFAPADGAQTSRDGPPFHRLMLPGAAYPSVTAGLCTCRVNGGLEGLDSANYPWVA